MVKKLKFLKYLSSLYDENIARELDTTARHLFPNRERDRKLLQSKGKKKAREEEKEE